MKTKEVKELLGHSFDSVSKYKGVFTVRRGFFYTHGGTADKCVNTVLLKIPGATIIESDEIWKAFSGGAPLAKQSHWYVKFTV